MIPNVIHFIFLGSREDLGGKPFLFIHFLAIYTAFKVHQPELIYFHYDHEPTGKWWQEAKPYLSLNKIEAPKEIFGNRLMDYTARADVVRLEKLIQYGGIYLDIDVISLKSFEPLRKYHAVMGIEYNVGLCNAVILSKKSGELLTIWLDMYRHFDESQSRKHAVLLPMELWKKYPHLLHVVDEDAFFYPMYDDPSQLYLWNDVSQHESIKHFLNENNASLSLRDLHHVNAGGEWQFEKLCGSYCIHLWQDAWFDQYLRPLTPGSILSKSSNFSRLIRRVMPTAELLNLSTI